MKAVAANAIPSGGGRTAYDSAEAHAVLKQYWGYDTFREGQEAIIRDVVAGFDVLAVLPTGAGKSLCYQLPAMLSGGITLVVSPLVALMADQVGALLDRGIRSVFLNSTQSYRERENAWADLEHGSCRLAFLSPEMLSSEVFESRAPRLNIACVAVDEAHCISEWGHEFRPSYQGIAAAVQKLSQVPLVAVTATAPQRVQEEIKSLLGLRTPREHIHDVDRPNIVWSVFRDTNLRRRVGRVLEGVPGQGVLYAGTRANTEAWARYLEDAGIAAAAYHAGMSHVARTKAQEAWFDGSKRVVVATSAFGMGIDKADVRFVLHTMLPASLDAYYQEAGRAGRDGAKSYAVLIAPDSDDDRLRSWGKERYPSAKEMRRVYDVVCDLGGLAVGSKSEAPFRLDTGKLIAASGLSGRRVRSAVDHLDRMGIWQTNAPRRGTAWVRMGREDQLRALAESKSKSEVRSLADALLRSERRPGPFDLTELDMREMSEQAGLPQNRIPEGLAYLQSIGVLEEVARDSQVLTLQHPRTRSPDLGRTQITRLRVRAQSRVEDVIAYASVKDCRRRLLRSYFGDKPPARCGACDNCIGRHKRADEAD